MPGFGTKVDKNFTWHPVEANSLDLADKDVVVVGGTNGIGRALALLMAERGATVTVAGRTFNDAGKSRINFMQADLSKMTEARSLGKKILELKPCLIVLTAGIMPGPIRQETTEGLEVDLAVSYLSRLTILDEICPTLDKSPGVLSKPMIFIMGFPGTNQAGNLNDLNSEESYPLYAHMNTVAGNEALVHHFTRHYSNINFYGLNPGLIKTNIRSHKLGHGTFRHWMTESIIGLLTITTETYAKRIVPLFFSKDIDSISGACFNQKVQAILQSPVMTEAYVEQYIAASRDLMKRTLPS